MSGIAAGAALLVAPPPLAAPAIGWRTTVERRGRGSTPEPKRMSSLIALYLADLAHNRSPACQHVQAAVGRSVGEEGAGPGGSIELLERGSDELGSLLVKATLEVWQAYRASAAGRGPLVLEIDAARAGYHMRRCSTGVLNFESVALDTVQTEANHRISLTT